MAREAAETLAYRSTMGVLAYPAILFTTIFMVPEESRRLWFVLPWGLLALLVVGVRLAAMWPFERRYPPDPAGWKRHFRAGVYASALIWVVFALEEMNANGSAWPTWMMLLMTAGIAAGATTSLCPDPPLLYRFLPLLLGPFLFWGLIQGGSSGHAIAVVVAVFLAFITAEARHNARSFRQSASDQEALREAGRRRDALVNSIDGIVWEAEPESGRFTFVSRRAETILGYPVERWLADSSFWKKHIHPADVESTVSYATSEAAAGGDYTLEYRMLAADGRAVWLRDIVSVKKEKEDEGIPALRGVMVDITAHKKASEERDMLADALRTVREAVTITDCDDRIVFVNDAFLKLYGYRRDEILSGTIDVVRSARNPAQLDAAIADGNRRGGWQGELWNRRKDGSEFPISLSTSLVRDQGGRTIAQVGVASDITQRKRAENEWKRAKEAAEAASRAKSEFLANLSHEIRTPMNGILGMNQLLIETPLDEHQRRYAEVTRDSARSLLSVLNDILDFSKIEAGKLELETVDFDLYAVTGGVSDLWAAKAQEKGIELLCLVEAGVPTRLRGDPGRLRQVLTNLVGNAVKFTAAGEVSIRVRLESSDPAVGLRFEVQDTGIGVPPDRQKLLFQPFSQADASTTRRFGGTGLGLTIVRRLVELMGGQVGFASEPGRGSCFWFTVAFVLQGSQPAPVSLAGKRIVVVDPNAASRGLLAQLLSDWGCRAELAAPGETADTLLHSPSVPFDGVIMVSRVARMGRPLWSALCEDPDLAGKPMVALFPFREGAGMAGRPSAGCAALTKPVKQGELAKCLGSLFDRAPQPASPQAPANARGPEPHPRRGARLLLVEDNRTNQEVALGVLQQLGYGAVDVAGDGRQALEMLERTEYDLVLMDCQMPEMDGYEATRRIRQRSAQVRHHRLPIVAMTAHALAGDRDQCLEAGMDDYLAKPVDPKVLAGVLEKWLTAVDGAAAADSPLLEPEPAVAGLPEPETGLAALRSAAAHTVELPANLPPALCPLPNGASGPASEQDILQTSVLDRLVEGVVITDAEACIQYVNQSFTRMTGYASEEVLGKNPRLLQSGRQDQVYYQRMWQTIRAGQVWRGEIVDRRKDGTEYTEEIVITPVASSAGQITNYIAVKLDKTRRRAEENAQRILAAIVESSEDGILSHTPEGTITSWNHGAEKVYGYRAEEILGRSVSLLVPPDLTHNLWPALKRLEAGKTISQLDCTGFSRDGRRINVSVSSSPIYDTSGRVVSVAVIVRDITARKRVQDDLRENEEQFRTIFADAPVGIARISLDGCFLQANAVLCRILGYSGQELAGKSWPELTHPDDLELSRKLQYELLGGLQSGVELEKRYTHKDGRTIPVRLRISLVRNAQGGPRYFIIHVEDISESRRSQEALKASEERYRLLFARNLAGVLRTTADGRILDCNQTAALILGWESPAEAIGKSVLDCFDSAGDREQLMKALSKQRVLTNSEWKFQRRGDPVWVLANFSFVEGGEGGEIEMTLIDITGRKRAEEQLREAKEVAERADRAKSAFLANMSHEIRTPMNGILGMIGSCWAATWIPGSAGVRTPSATAPNRCSGS